jgi:ketosteroid isomerase-like protein
MNKLCTFLAVVYFLSCRQTEKPAPFENVEAKQKMMDTDRAFAKMSKEQGMKKAFIKFLDDDGVLLRPEQYPLMGAEAIDFLTSINDTTFSFIWEPQKGAVSNSDDLGYTYGVYKLTPTNVDTTIYGTYVNIWKKQTDSTWKLVLETGNEGIGAIKNDTLQ